MKGDALANMLKDRRILVIIIAAVVIIAAVAAVMMLTMGFAAISTTHWR